MSQASCALAAREIDSADNLAAQKSACGSKAEGYKVLRRLYKAVSHGDVEIVKALVAPDIEWWFHGPRSEQHLMRMLTGVDRLGSIAFRPSRVCCFEQDKFVAEGILESSPASSFSSSSSSEASYGSSSSSTSTSTCWVHVFTIKAGKVVELREYFNTSVTVTRGSSNPLWESQVTEYHGGRVSTMPGLIVAV